MIRPRLPAPICSQTANTSCMTGAASPLPYDELVALVDDILDTCDDEVPCIVNKLEAVDGPARDEILVSDLLNAYQVFYYFFRADPGDLVRERLELEPASSLRAGLLIEETDLLEMYFGIKERKPVIVLSDGDKIVAAFSGTSAYGQGRQFLDNPEWQ